MKAVNLTTGELLASRVEVADTFFARMKGLLGKACLPAGEALWIKPCNSVHTFGMNYSIDVVFLDKKKRIVALRKTLKPNRISKLHPRACSVLELPPGTIDCAGTVIGNHIEIA